MNIDRKTLEHERMRFKTMTRRELETRLYKMTKLDKIKAFAAVAKEFGGFQDLEAKAWARVLLLNGTLPVNVSKKPDPKPSIVVKKKVAETTQSVCVIHKPEAPLKRLIEF